MTELDTLVPAAYTIPAGTKERIEKLAKEEDLNPSQLVRRILREYFEELDAASKPKRISKN